MNNQLPLLICQHFFSIPMDGIGVDEIEVKCKWCGEAKTFMTNRGVAKEMELRHVGDLLYET